MVIDREENMMIYCQFYLFAFALKSCGKSNIEIIRLVLETQFTYYLWFCLLAVRSEL